MESTRGAPALLIAVLSAGTHRVDEQTKWLDVVRVFRRQPDGSFPVVARLSQQDEILSTPILPGLAIRLRELFA